MLSQSPDPFAGQFAGKVVVITGAGAGIGRVTVDAFVREGAKVLAADISGRQDEVALFHGPDVVACQVDIRSEAEIEAMYLQALDTFGRVDAAIHVAGIPGGRRSPEITAEEFDDLTQVHLRGTLLCCKHAGRAILRGGRGGAIVNFSSAASLAGDARISTSYAAAKAGINSLTRSYALHLGEHNIRVNAILPGFTLSEKNRAAPPEALAALSRKSSLGRPGRPEETAEAALFLASERASFISGVILPVDGGWTARLA